MTTANLLLPELASGQTAKELGHNQALHILDALVQCAVIDRDLTAPPGSPVDGNIYIPKATATGAWAGKENNLAQWDVNVWKFHTPEEGWLAWVRDEDILVAYSGSAWVTAAGAGSVTSVALTVPSDLSVSGSPVTSSGTLAVTRNTQSANKVLASPSSGAAAIPTYRALVPADVPTMVASGASHAAGATPDTPSSSGTAKYLREDATWAVPPDTTGSGTVTSVALSVPSDLSVSGSPITSSGTLAVSRATQTANTVLAGPTSGGAATPAYRALVAADIPSQPYDVGAFLEAAPTASQVVLRHVFARQVIFASGLSPSQGVAGTAATAQTDFDLQKNGSSVGTMRFAAAGTVASFIMASQTTFAAGDKLTVVAPATPDSTLAKHAFTLAGTR